MMLAYTMAPGRGDTDLILERLATDLAAQGVRCCGTVQINTERCTAGLCDMDIRVLPDGPILRISQDLGPSARGCRLDPAALETAVGLVGAQLSEGADLLIINKFGKQEADGRGFRDVIAQAVELDVPVLVGLNKLNRAGFEAFASGMATQLPPDGAALRKWARTATETEIA
ncbi:DUF2478 domain-containing protein [Roseovarius sp. S4756]|uniref:DUF2478 domain-containing protein n=1 Tax=Roseovarius maritimus TaxID=3342637 RepID=UPI00372A88E0